MTRTTALWLSLTGAVVLWGLVGGGSWGQDLPGRVTDGLVALYLFNEGAGDFVTDQSGFGEPLRLVNADPAGATWAEGGGFVIFGQRAALISPLPAAKIVTAAQATNQLTIEAVVTPQDTEHTGPARIVSLSRDPYSRNFTLAQVRGQYILRLRTSQTDEQGLPDMPSYDNMLLPERQHVVAVYDQIEVRFYVNGEFAGQGARSGDFSNWDPSFRLILGNEASMDRQWAGKLELVAIYARALTPAEVDQNFRAMQQ